MLKAEFSQRYRVRLGYLKASLCPEKQRSSRDQADVHANLVELADLTSVTPLAMAQVLCFRTGFPSFGFYIAGHDKVSNR
jgi:hypothetical protein